MNWFKRNKVGFTVSILIIILLICIGFTSQGRSNTTLIEGGISKIISPIEYVLYSTTRYVNNFYNSIVSMGTLQQRNIELEEEIDNYKQMLVDYQKIVNENIELRDMLNFKEQNPQYAFIPANIISIDPDVNFSIFVIDKGSKNGIQQNMTVVLNNGLVGRISEVSIGTSKVLAIIDKGSMVNGIDVRTGDYIRITGSSNNILIGYVENEARIVAGDIIVTSGLAGVFRENMIIGDVIDISKQEGMLEKKVTIKPSVDFDKIGKVLIVSEK